MYYSRTSSRTVNWFPFLPLIDLTESNRVGIVEYAQGHRLLDEPAFAWWVPHFLKNRDRIVRKLAMAECFRTCVKSGFKVPKNIDLS